MFRVSLSMRSDSLPVGLLNSGSSGLWSVANLNFGAPSRYIWSLVVVNSAASSLLSILSIRGPPHIGYFSGLLKQSTT